MYAVCMVMGAKFIRAADRFVFLSCLFVLYFVFFFSWFFFVFCFFVFVFLQRQFLLKSTHLDTNRDPAKLVRCFKLLDRSYELPSHHLAGDVVLICTLTHRKRGRIRQNIESAANLDMVLNFYQGPYTPVWPSGLVLTALIFSDWCGDQVLKLESMPMKRWGRIMYMCVYEQAKHAFRRKSPTPGSRSGL